MACPYLWGKYVRTCSASSEAYVPGVFELREYCCDGRYERFLVCPVYRSSGRDHACGASEDRQGRATL